MNALFYTQQLKTLVPLRDWHCGMYVCLEFKYSTRTTQLKLIRGTTNPFKLMASGVVQGLSGKERPDGRMEVTQTGFQDEFTLVGEPFIWQYLMKLKGNDLWMTEKTLFHVSNSIQKYS